MAIILPDAFQPIGAGGVAQISPRKILGADEWTDIVANDAYLRSSLCRRRTIGFANLADPMELETAWGSTARYFELFRGRFGLSEGRTSAIFDYDLSSTQLRVRHYHISELQSITSIIDGGAGYTPGDILTVIGGTGTPATIQVSDIPPGPPTGPIDGAALQTPGNYTAFPRSALVGHGPETLKGTFGEGKNYSAADVLTVIGGTGTAATLTVGTVSSGRIRTFSAHTGGDYSLSPFDTVLTTVAPSGGTGARLTLDFGHGGVRHCTVTGGTGSGAVFNISREILAMQEVSSGGRSQGTMTFSAIPETSYDVVIEARNLTNPGTAEFFALRYREAAILVGDL